MIKIYDSHMNYQGPLFQYKNLQITAELKNGYKICQFSVPYAANVFLQEEQKLEIENYLFVVKEINMEDDLMYDVYCKPYWSGLAAKHIDSITGYSMTLQEAMDKVCADTGWTPVFMQDIYGIYTVNIQRQSALDALAALKNLYQVDFAFDTKSKEIQVWAERGTFKETYTISASSFCSCRIQSNTYDLVTRLIPIGKDGTTINMVNNGSIWVEDYSYTDDVIVAYWFPSNISNADDLLKLAKDRIKTLARPQTTYQISSWALQTDNLSVGDTIRIIDTIKNIDVTERIAKTVTYPEQKEKSYIELGQPAVSFDDIYKSLTEAQKIVNEDTLRNLSELNNSYQ